MNHLHTKPYISVNRKKHIIECMIFCHEMIYRWATLCFVIKDCWAIADGWQLRRICWQKSRGVGYCLGPIFLRQHGQSRYQGRMIQHIYPDQLIYSNKVLSPLRIEFIITYFSRLSVNHWYTSCAYKGSLLSILIDIVDSAYLIEMTVGLYWDYISPQAACCCRLHSSLGHQPQQYTYVLIQGHLASPAE